MIVVQKRVDAIQPRASAKSIRKARNHVRTPRRRPSHLRAAACRPGPAPGAAAAGWHHQRPRRSRSTNTRSSRATSRLLKNGEYVYYELSLGSSQPGSASVPRQCWDASCSECRCSFSPTPSSSEPEVSPSQVAALVGYDMRASDLFELHVAIMGYYDETFGSFVNPWIPPSSGTPIYLADDAWLATVLSRKQARSGRQRHDRLAADTPANAPCRSCWMSRNWSALISPSSPAPARARAIWPASSSRRLMRPYNRAAVLIIDPARRIQHPAGDRQRRGVPCPGASQPARRGATTL